MSIARSFVTQPICTTNALFQAWGNNISNAFADAGWAKTSDTGQIVWSTIAAPAAANVVCGYEIWQMQDALQATAPVFVKIEYGSGTAQTNPFVATTIGSGSTGDGRLTGILSARFILNCSNGANQAISYVSGSTNRFGIGLWVSGYASNSVFGVPNQTPTSNTATGIAAFFSIERTKDTNGNDTNEGVLFLNRNPGAGGGATFRAQYWNCLAGPSSSSGEDWGTLVPSANATANLGSWAGIGTPGPLVYPVYHHKGIFLNPGLNVLCYNYPTLTVDQKCNVVFYSANHAYMPFANTFGGGAISQRAYQNTFSFAMRYE